MYAEKFKIDVVKLMNRYDEQLFIIYYLKMCNFHLVFYVRLWGENFFNPTTRKWAKQKDDTNQRSFCMYILDPIYKVCYNF